MKKHDYAEALKEELKWLPCLESIGDKNATEHAITVISALRIAQKVMQEPSEAMSDAGSGYVMTETGHISCFKSMRDQMIKELEQEK